MKKISVIIPNLNGLVYLKRSLPMVLNFLYENLEIIVVDNGSTDDSTEYLKKIKDKRFVFLESPVKGSKNFACNYAVQASSGEYVLMLDNDILISDVNLIEKLLERYSLHSKSDHVGCISLSHHDLGKTNSLNYGYLLGFFFIKEKPRMALDLIEKFDGSMTSYPSGAGFFIQKQTWKEAGGYDDHLTYGGDDTDLGIRLWLLGFKNYLYAKNIFTHIGTPERDDNKKFEKKWRLIFYAHLFTILKNYNNYNVLPALLGYSIFGFLKSIKQSLKRLDLGPVKSYIKGYLLFVTNFKIGLQKRKIIQSRRKFKRDVFLEIKLTKNNFI